MFRNPNEEELAQFLYATIKKANKEVTKESLKPALLTILRVESQKGSMRMQEQFQRFYMNKMLHSGRQKAAEEYSYKPKLNPATVKLAKKSRERQRQVVSSSGKALKNNATVTDLLTMVRREDSQSESMQEIRRRYSAKGIVGKEKSELLFNRSKKLRRPYDKTTEEVEYEKAKNDLTFTPKISR
eukprot:TRINITY_DN9114_c0_g1_i11.p1 TRINITY_DN9114_c0_g1~~TRINITY_DN9114_c0_g1_i11.p1  ORF type:complete len:185 (+),score=47.84 TRINITY_DN9114_c0_g1_i11:113-667(+)